MVKESVWDRIGRLLPEEHRERFFAMVSRLDDMPQDDEILLIMEGMGLMTLLWREVPEEIDSILKQAKPADTVGSRETTAFLLSEIGRVVRETLDQPTHEDLRALMGELRDSQREFHGSVRRLEQSQGQRSKRPTFWKAFVGLLVMNAGVVCAGLTWLHGNRQVHLEKMEMNVTAAEALVQMLARRPMGSISSYEGMDPALNENVRAVVVDGPVIDTFTDELGRGVIRLQGTR